MAEASMLANVRNAQSVVKAKRTPMPVHSARMGKIAARPDFAIRLEKARKKRGFADAAAAAKFFGWNYDSYIQHERGERGIGRAAEKYALAYNVSEAWLLTGEGEETPSVPIVGYVAAGVWSDPNEMDEARPPQDFVSPDPRLPIRYQRAWIVRGRSVEKHAQDGTILVCALLGDGSPIEPRDGDLVIAERRREQGGLVERTAKKLRILMGKSELLPQYEDEALNTPIPLGDDNDEVAVIAVVLGAYKPMRGLT